MLLEYVPGDRHPLAPNYYALLLVILRRYSVDQALALMGVGHHCNISEATAVGVARRNCAPAGDCRHRRRPPAWAELAAKYG